MIHFCEQRCPPKCSHPTNELDCYLCYTSSHSNYSKYVQEQDQKETELGGYCTIRSNIRKP